MDYKLHHITLTATHTVKTGTADYNGEFENPVIVSVPTATTVVTVPDGEYVGQTLFITCPDANSQTVTASVSHHVTSDPEIFTFTSGLVLLLIWNGSKWNTVFSTATV
jgi:hypothetical protein